MVRSRWPIVKPRLNCKFSLANTVILDFTGVRLANSCFMNALVSELLRKHVYPWEGAISFGLEQHSDPR